MSVRALRTCCAVLFLAALAISTPNRSSAQTFSDPGFVSELVATVSPFTLVGMAWSPDGRLFVWQKNGVVRVIEDGVLLPTPFVDLSAKVNTYDDRGFWGLAFHPDFTNNRFVYLSYVLEDGSNPNDTGPKTSRVVRVTANPANPAVALPGSEVVILGSIGTPPCSAQPTGSDCIAADSGSHHWERCALRRTERCSWAAATARMQRLPTPVPAGAGSQQLEREDPARQRRRDGTAGQSLLRRDELDQIQGMALRGAQSVPVLAPSNQQ